MDDDIEEVVYQDGTTADVAIYEYLKYKEARNTNRRKYLHDEFITIDGNDILDYEFEAPNHGVIKVSVETLEGKECEIGLLPKSDYIQTRKGNKINNSDFIFRKIFNQLDGSIFSIVFDGTHVLYIKNLSDSQFSLKLSLEYVPKKGILSELSRSELNQLTTNRNLPRNIVTNIMILYTSIPLVLIAISAFTIPGLASFILLMLYPGIIINPIMLYFEVFLSRKDGPFPRSKDAFQLYLLFSIFPGIGHIVLMIYLIHRKTAKSYPRSFNQKYFNQKYKEFEN